MRIEYVQTLFERHFLIGETSPDLLPEERKKRIFRTQKQLSALSAGKLQRGKKLVRIVRKAVGRETGQHFCGKSAGILPV